MWIIHDKTKVVKGVATCLDNVDSRVALAIMCDENINMDVKRQIRDSATKSSDEHYCKPIGIIYDSGYKVVQLGHLKLFAMFNAGGKQLGIFKSCEQAEDAMLDVVSDISQSERHYEFGYKAIWSGDEEDEFTLKA